MEPRIPAAVLVGGSLFSINTDGSGFTNLHSFTATVGNAGYNASGTNSDGANPDAGLILFGNTLFGTAENGGSSGNGTVFAINTDGTGFTNLHSFTTWKTNSLGNPTNSDGISPRSGLIVSGNILYGTAWYGGSSASGTIFKLNTNGTSFTTLHSFTATPQTSWINSDGVGPNDLILSGNTLFGTAVLGGSSGNGTVFSVNISGSGFMTLHSFTALSNSTNSDGCQPKVELLISSNTLYGTAVSGGGSGNGTIFAVKTNGAGFTTLHSFSALSNSSNTDGVSPNDLILSGNTLYGTASSGGSFGKGTVFAVNIDGTSFKNFHNFTTIAPYPYYTNSDGASPYSGLILSGSTLFGTAVTGGKSGNGTLFSLSSPIPSLTIIFSVANLILTWPSFVPGVTLQTTTNLVSPAVWSTNSPAPSLVNGQNAVTNPISSPQQFFRLMSN